MSKWTALKHYFIHENVIFAILAEKSTNISQDVKVST